MQVRLGGTDLQLSCRPPAAEGSSGAAAAGTAGGGRTAAEALAALVLACPALFSSADVLELCSWVAPLASLAALRWCRRAVAAGASEAGLELLRRNARRNGHLFVIERLRLQQLEWQEQEGQLEAEQGRREQRRQQQQRQLLQAFPAGFTAVLAAAPTSSGDLCRLLSSAAALLSRRNGALVLLCACDAAALQRAAEAAPAAGLREASPLPAELATAAGMVAGSSPVHFLGLQHCC